MKTLFRRFALVACSSLALSAFAQESPAPAVAPSPAATVATSVIATPVPSVSPEKDDLESRIDRKVKKGLHISIGDDEADRERRRARASTTHIHHDSSDDSDGWMAVPIVGIIFSTLFGTPVLIVAAIMFFSYLKSRSLHRTVRMMVERGEPVPPALFAPTPVLRARSDMRRGVVLVMVGIGLMVFFGACNDWEGGAWAVGIIPFLIGAGYLLVWKLEGPKVNAYKPSTDNPAPLP